MDQKQSFIKRHRGSYMSAHVLLNILNELRKRDKMRGLPSIWPLFRNKFNKFNNTRFYLSYDIKITLGSCFLSKNFIIWHYVPNVVMDVITFPVNL